MPAVDADPDLAAPENLAAILEHNGLVGSADPLPAGHVLALIADGGRWIRLHSLDYPRSS
jgi:hypothetical protein